MSYGFALYLPNGKLWTTSDDNSAFFGLVLDSFTLGPSESATKVYPDLVGKPLSSFAVVVNHAFGRSPHNYTYTQSTGTLHITPPTKDPDDSTWVIML